ncbi:baseplate assembly protein, partial [Helicobacter valdiviensis]
TQYVSEAITKWEKRVELKGVRLNSLNNHKLNITLLFNNHPSIEVQI